jgi:YidC/Oxa1 family membrane protein insertase
MSKGMSNIQPKMQEIQDKYKDNPQKLSEETMKLLKKEGSAPLKGCLSMLIQLPVFIGLYFVVRKFAI